MAKIIVDHRESQDIIKELSRENEIEIRQLIVADIVIEGKTEEGKNKLIGIERKTKNDFLNSIIDKRIITQLSLLRETFEYPLLIIEGTENLYRIRNFHPNSIRGMLAAIAIDLQIPMLYTRNYKDTSKLISLVAKKMEKPKKLSSLLKKRKPLTLKEQQELLISTLPGVGSEISKSLLKKFKSIKNIMNANETQLKEVEKIGSKKSSLIKNLIEKEYEENKL